MKKILIKGFMEILNAIYNDGKLILENKEIPLKKNQKVKVIILENTKSHKKEDFFKFISEMTLKTPDAYSFNRDELHER